MRGKPGILGAISSFAAVAAAAALAAGPAGAVTAASGTGAARMTAARTTAVARPAAGRPLRGWAATLLPGTARRAHAMTPQAPAAAASSIFSGAALEGVSCTGRKQCTATGLASTRNGKNYKPLAERWNGTAWAKQTTPIPSSGGLLGGTLTAGVSCTSSSACMAAGYAYSAKTVRLLGEGWNGRIWSIQPDSTPATAGEPFHISCTWAKDCIAVGERNSGMTLAEHWNGRKWSAVTTKHDGELIGVACPATGNCTAVGQNMGGKALAAHWNGKAWSDQSVASPDQFNALSGVSCTAVKDCVAVGTGGSVTSSALDLAPLAEHWTGGKWAVLTVPDPAPAGDTSELNSVSCTSATNCMAVGDYTDQAVDADTTVAEQWNGTTWTVLTTPSPATFSILGSVSCPSAGHCIAVGGSSATATGAVSPLTEVWNGTTWTVVTAPR